MWDAAADLLLKYDIQSFINTVNRLADTSERVIRSFDRRTLAIDSKSDASPVTDADRAAEYSMREVIMQEYHDHGILGEEFGHTGSDARFQWVLDPIDGTKSFISGTPLFGTLIGLCDGGTPILGCINLPALGQRYIGTPEQTRCNGRTVRMRSTESIRQATVLVTDHVDVWRHKNGLAFDRLAAKANIFRSWGDCYGYTLLASGFADIMVDPLLKPWDLLPLIPVMQGAGATVTSYEGSDPLHSDSLLVSHPDLHAEVVALLNPLRPEDCEC